MFQLISVPFKPARSARSLPLYLAAFFLITTTSPSRAEVGAEATALVDHPAVSQLKSIFDQMKENTDQEASERQRAQQNLVLVSDSVHWLSFYKQVFGRSWLKLDAEQQQILGKKFKQLVIYTYTYALAELSDYQLEYQRVNVSPRPDIISVDIKAFNVEDATTLAIQIRMRKIEDQWQAFDLVFSGASVSSAYRSNYRPYLKKNGYVQTLQVIDEAIVKQQDKLDATLPAGGSSPSLKQKSDSEVPSHTPESRFDDHSRSLAFGAPRWNDQSHRPVSVMSTLPSADRPMVGSIIATQRALRLG